ncbi:MAG: acyltransferase family protein [Lysobacteraceae bacterium]
MDHLRALAMLAGVLFHAALAHSPLMHGFWPTADRQHSAWVDGAAWGLHLVRMPLFFLIAGFFAAWTLQRRNPGGLVWQRLRRIALPFVVALPLVLWAMTASTTWAATQVEHPSPLLLMVAAFIQMPDPPRAPPTTAHLWFLYYLLLFTVLHWVVRALDLGRVGGWLARRSPLWILAGVPALLLIPLASVSAPHPAPESLLPQFWAIALYGAFFAVGTLLHGQPDWLQRTRRHVPWLAVAVAALYALFLWRLAAEPPGPAHPTASWPMAALQACLITWLTVLCLMAGRRLLDRPNPVIGYLSRAAYWTYLVHLPVLFALQYRLMDRDLVWPLKLALSTTLTLAVCLLSYQLLVRHTPLRRFVG